MATIIHHGGDCYEVQATNGYRPDGKRRRVSRRVHGTMRDAQALAVRLDMEMGSSPALGSGATLDGYFEGVFLASHADLDPSTLANYRTLWRLHVSPRFGSRPVAEPSPADVQTWVSSMTRGNAVHAAKLLRSVLRDAWYMGIIPSEPMRRPLRYPKSACGKLDVWDGSEVLYALSRLHGHRLLPLVAVMVGAGLRRSEAMALRWEDMSFSDGYVRMTIVRGAHADDGSTKNPESVRTVAVMEPFASILAETRGEGPICPMTMARAAKVWRNLFEGAVESEDGRRSRPAGPLHGMRYIPMKQLRATNTTLMHEAGVPDTTLSMVHGHTDVRTDYRHYIAPTSTAADTAAKMLQSFMMDADSRQFRAVSGA